MRHRGRGVKVVGFLIFLTPETHWFSVGIGSILRLDYILNLFSFSVGIGSIRLDYILNLFSFSYQ